MEPEVPLHSPELPQHFICLVLSSLIAFRPLLYLGLSYLPLYLPSCFSHCLTHGILLIDVVITGVGQQIFHLSAPWAGDKIALPTAFGSMTSSGAGAEQVPFRWKHLTASAPLLLFLPVSCDLC